MAEDNDNYFKILVVGDGGVGKTCLINRYIHDVFQLSTRATIGVEFLVKDGIEYNDESVTLQVWDIAGQERYAAMCRVYFQAAVGAVVVYDLTNPSTFESATRWKDQIDQKVSLTDGSPVPCVLVGNKCDRKNSNAVGADQIAAICREYGFVGSINTSAKTNVNVNEAFQILVKEIMKNEERLLAQPTPTTEVSPPEVQPIRLVGDPATTRTQPDKKGKGCSCPLA